MSVDGSPIGVVEQEVGIEREELGGGRLRTAGTVVAVAAASLMLPLAVTAPSVAMGHLTSDLGASAGASSWVLNAYNVTFAAFMLAAGSLADRFGRRRLLTGGIVVFVAASLACVLANSIVAVDIARAIQGVGAAAILTSGAAVLANAFQGAQRAKAFGILGASFGCGLAIGPMLAGFLVEVAGWRSVFVINIPIGIVVLVLTRLVSESRNPDAGRLDLWGMATFSGALLMLTTVLAIGPTVGWVSVTTVLALIAAVALLVAFAMVETRVAEPMFDVSLFRRPTFVAVVCQPFTITFGFVVLLVNLPLYFQGTWDVGPTASGALLLPLTLPVLLLPSVAGRIAAHIPLRVMLGSSSVLITIGSVWLMTLSSTGSVWTVAGPLLVFGVGVGTAFGVMDNAAVSVVPTERAGMAAGIFNTMRITGEGVAIAGATALLTTLAAVSFGQSGFSSDSARHAAGSVVQGHNDSAQTALGAHGAGGVVDAAITSGLHWSFLVIAVLAAVGAIVTFLAIDDNEIRAGD